MYNKMNPNTLKPSFMKAHCCWICFRWPVFFSPSDISSYQDELEITNKLYVAVPMYRGAQEQQAQSNVEDIPKRSWYQSVFSSSSHPSTPSSSSGISAHKRASDHPQSPPQGQPSLAEAAKVIAHLKDKSIDELRKLLTDKEAYNIFLHSLDQVKNQNNVCDERRRETLQLARENLEKELPILELRNQYTIIRTTELASAREKFTKLERQKEEMMRSYSPASLLQKLHGSLGSASLWPVADVKESSCPSESELPTTLGILHFQLIAAINPRRTV